jgi:HPt (histidine-containing phosphotransfer) domain-containing protein
MDFGYLEGFAAGDRTVVTEVLNLFLQQAQAWSKGLAPDNGGWAALVHTIKGASRGIGATSLAGVCERAEAEGPGSLAAVAAALDAAVADITAYLARSAAG